jgi:putative oxidoreductase
MNDAFRAVWTPRMLSVLRIVVGLLFLQHGLVKVFGFPSAAPPVLGPLLQLAAAIEVIGSVLLIAGLFTRPVAFLMSGEMAIAYFWAHAPNSFYPIINRGEAAILFCFVFLYLALAGAGPWSVDAQRKA